MKAKINYSQALTVGVGIALGAMLTPLFVAVAATVRSAFTRVTG